MFNIFNKIQLESIETLDIKIKNAALKPNPLALREKVKILVIDDQFFDPAENLKANGYKIDQIRDLNRIQDAFSYQIVLCDLQGVGSSLNRELQGAHIIKEIKNNSPQTIVIAYTGIAANQKMAKLAKDQADNYLKKDAALDEWMSTLDGHLNNITNPVYMWKEMRKKMLDRGITPLQLAYLEDEFVRNYNLGSDVVKQKIDIQFQRLGIANDIRAIIQGFISSLIYSSVAG